MLIMVLSNHDGAVSKVSREGLLRIEYWILQRRALRLRARGKHTHLCSCCEMASCTGVLGPEQEMLACSTLYMRITRSPK